MIVTTTNTIEGKKIISYKGFVSGTVLIGANIVNDFSAGVTDIFGGRSNVCETKIEEAKVAALHEIEEEAKKVGGNAIVGVSMDVQVTTMVLIMVTGTAVTIE